MTDYVSRGGIKLKAALDHFQIDCSGKTVLDIGSSTGGFVDCLLQYGAAKVFALDTAYGELAWKLRNDPRVVVMERTNVLHMDPLAEKVDMVTIDAGWTRLELVLPKIKTFLKEKGVIIALLKPHYEAERQFHKGVVPYEIVEKVKDKVKENISALGFLIIDEMESPLLGGGGNKEYLLLIK